ncbi:MAG TPA: winged helix DNA-binding domain-containing protein [Myxococcales bacterium]|nr:winged helix DNA-binding domain-containing protein [Myxococcales bacterium]
MARLTLRQLRALRTASQRLDRPPHRSVGELVRALGGVQAQVLSSAELALRARAKGLRRADVTAAREGDRSIVWCWAMRGTMHLVAADDLGWMLPVFAPLAFPHSKRRLKQLGVREDHVDPAVEHIERALRDDGPLPRRELAARLARRDIETRGQAIAHLVHVAAMRGRICFGPLRGRDQTFAALADWLPGFRPREPDSAELARRFLGAYGPAAPADFAAWSGLSVPAAREAFGGISAELSELEGPGGEALWSLRRARRSRAARVARLLPSFDGFLLGYADRAFALAAGHAKKVNAGGGWLHPLLFVDGEIAGTWSTGGALKPFAPLPAKARAALEADAVEVRAFQSG